MKTNFYVFAIIVAIGLSVYNMKTVLKADRTFDLSKLTIETLAEESSTSEQDVMKCDIFKYTRNAQEAWIPYKILDTDITMGTQIKLPSGITIPLTASVKVGVTVRYADCSKSEGNCCLKSHVDKSVRLF